MFLPLFLQPRKQRTHYNYFSFLFRVSTSIFFFNVSTITYMYRGNMAATQNEENSLQVMQLTLSLPNKYIVLFYWLKMYFHCKIKKRFNYDVERKCGQCRSEIRLHILCSLMSDLHCPQKPLVSSSVRKEIREQTFLSCKCCKISIPRPVGGVPGQFSDNKLSI